MHAHGFVIESAQPQAVVTANLHGHRPVHKRISGFRFALQLPLVATFYSPNTEDEDHSITSTVGDISDVSYGASFVYDWLDATKTYAAENIATFPTEPTLDFAEAFLVADSFAHA